MTTMLCDAMNPYIDMDVARSICGNLEVGGPGAICSRSHCGQDNSCWTADLSTVLSEWYDWPDTYYPADMETTSWAS